MLIYIFTVKTIGADKVQREFNAPVMMSYYCSIVRDRNKKYNLSRDRRITNELFIYMIN